MIVLERIAALFMFCTGIVLTMRLFSELAMLPYSTRPKVYAIKFAIACAVIWSALAYFIWW